MAPLTPLIPRVDKNPSLMVAVGGRPPDRMGQPTAIQFRSGTVNDPSSSWPARGVVPHRRYALEVAIQGLRSISPIAVDLLIACEPIVVNGRPECSPGTDDRRRCRVCPGFKTYRRIKAHGVRACSLVKIGTLHVDQEQVA